MLFLDPAILKVLTTMGRLESLRQYESVVPLNVYNVSNVSSKQDEKLSASQSARSYEIIYIFPSFSHTSTCRLTLHPERPCACRSCVSGRVSWLIEIPSQGRAAGHLIAAVKQMAVVTWTQVA